MVPLTLLSSSGINFLLKINKILFIPHFQVGLKAGEGDEDKVDLLLGAQLLGEVLD